MAGDDERRLEAAFLRSELSAAIAESARLRDELVHLTAHIHDIRAAFGNPFYYSNPEHPDEGVANYSANSSHEVGLDTLLKYMRGEKRIARLRQQLRNLGGDVP